MLIILFQIIRFYYNYYNFLLNFTMLNNYMISYNLLLFNCCIIFSLYCRGTVNSKWIKVLIIFIAVIYSLAGSNSFPKKKFILQPAVIHFQKKKEIISNSIGINDSFSASTGFLYA